MGRNCRICSRLPTKTFDGRRPWVGAFLVARLLFYLSGLCWASGVEFCKEKFDGVTDE